MAEVRKAEILSGRVQRAGIRRRRKLEYMRC